MQILTQNKSTIVNTDQAIKLYVNPYYINLQIAGYKIYVEFAKELSIGILGEYKTSKEAEWELGEIYIALMNGNSAYQMN